MSEKDDVEDVKLKIVTEITEDGLNAKIQIVTQGAQTQRFSAADVIQSLKEEGIVHGIKDDILQELVDNQTVNEWIDLAQGDPPVNGKDGEILYHFAKEGPGVRLKEDARGKVNLWDLNLIQNIKKGEVICSLVPPDNGKPGKNVKGFVIPATEGKPAVLPKGENVECSEDGNKLIATIDGMIEFIGDTVNVNRTYTVEAVDAATGNINFVGSVVVNGEVGDGFEVHAGEDLTIAMSVGHVTLSAGGNIEINGGILKGSINARGNLRAKFIQDAEVTTKGSIVVDDYIQNSEVIAEGPIAVKNTAGWISGGAVSSENFIYSTNIGKADASANTEIIIGSHPHLNQVKTTLEGEILTRVEDFQQFRSSILKIRALKAKGPLPPNQEQLYKKILHAIDFIRSEMITKQTSVDEISGRIQKAYSGEILVPGSVFGGTKLRIGNKGKNIERLCSSTRFYLDNNELKEEVFISRKDIEDFLKD